MKICIDAGHNHSGHDTGASGNGLREQDITFEIAKRTGELLKSAGFSVLLTRNAITDNIGTSLHTSLSLRSKMANDFKADLFISVHCNASENPTAKGTETFIYNTKSAARHIAEKVNSSIVNNLGTIDRGVKENPNLAVLKNTAMPAVLVETAFISNAEDAKKLKEKPGEFAKAIADAICHYYGVNKPDNALSCDKTVDNMMKDGVTTPENMAYWEKVLNNKEPVNLKNLRIILDRYHEKLIN
jgi:N-acetylmuramoyl-L-alanine amidase